MARCVVLAALLLISMALISHAGQKPYQTAGWVGANYTPAYCVNAVQLWHDFRPDVIDKELAAAREHFGITSLRVFLHNIPYDAEREQLLGRIDRFLAICDRHGIRPGFVFFDDCWNHKGITLDSPPPIKGRHNGRWAACPQDVDRTEEKLPELKAYVQDVIRAHRRDERVLWWEIYNEPHRRSEYSARLRKLGYQWAKEIKPIQPIICCWNDSPETDIVDAHNYSANFAAWDKQVELNPAKGAVFTEAGARWMAPKPNHGEPIDVIHWLRARQAAGKYVPGVYLCWELMVGNSNCRWHWGTKDGAPEPTIPWCGLMWPDGTPVSLAEAEAIRHYTTGEKRAMLFDDFQDAPPPQKRPGWKAYGPAGAGASGALALPPDARMIAGDPQWTDYVLEATVMLKGTEGNAGLVFRVNDPGPGDDRMRGYYVGLDTKKLCLAKMNDDRQELAAFDLDRLECKIVPGVWNQIRVAVEGSRIRVRLNRMHHDDGLRIDYTDRRRPVLSGAVGVRTHQVGAWFDNVVVLPSSQ